jgi:Ser/Thr protein kinase RdoA (MazF antagonist)
MPPQCPDVAPANRVWLLSVAAPDGSRWREIGTGCLTAAVISDGRVREILTDHWGLHQPAVSAHHTGMNSATWLVEQDGHRWVAKAVPTPAGGFAAGLELAARLQAAGVPAGAPVPSLDGHQVIMVDGVALALLTWVAGQSLTKDHGTGQRVLGRTLARVHRLLREVAVDGVQTFHWIDVGATHLAIRGWIRPAVAGAVAAFDRLDPPSLTQGLLHADPSPDAFRLDHRTGVCGLIDWGAALAGPLMYDVASAVMYVGGPRHARALLRAYLAEGVLPEPEVDRALPVMLQLRWAVQADYFARRIASGDLTGIAGPAENEVGLEDARRWLLSHG